MREPRISKSLISNLVGGGNSRLNFPRSSCSILLARPGVDNFFGSRAVLKKFGPFGPHIINSIYLTVIFLHQIQKNTKNSPRVGQETSAGRILPAGRTLPTP